MGRIKILYVYMAMNRGAGGEMHPMVLAKHLDQSRFDFQLCVIERASPWVAEELKQANCRLYSLGLSRRFYNPFGVLRIFYRLSRLCAKLKPDIVQTQALHANLLARPAARWAGVPTIISTENSLPDIERDALRRALNAPLHGLNRLLDRGTQRIVVVSDSVRRWKDPGGKSPKVRVIAPPFRLEAFISAETQRPQAHSVSHRSPPVLGVVGRLSAEKGHRFLLAAMPAILAQSPQVQLLIVGSGPLEAELRAEAEALALTKSVHFLGYVREVQAVYARMDMLLVPSLSEAFSLVTLEGMMMELPVVGSRVGGIAEIVLDGETGLLVPPGDSAAIGAACRRLLSRPELGRQMGQRGRQRALAKFHPAEFVARHEELYVCVAGGDRAGPA